MPQQLWVLDVDAADVPNLNRRSPLKPVGVQDGPSDASVLHVWHCTDEVRVVDFIQRDDVERF